MKTPLACEGRAVSPGVPVRRFRLQKLASSALGSEKRVPPATGRVDGGLAPRALSRHEWGEKALIARVTAAKPYAREGPSRTLERALRGDGPCRTEGISGRISRSPRSRGRTGARPRQLPAWLLRASEGVVVGDATGMPEARPHTPRRDDNARRGGQMTLVRPAEANRSDVTFRRSPGRARSAS